MASETEPPSRYFPICGSCKPQSGQPYRFVSCVKLKSNTIKNDE